MKSRRAIWTTGHLRRVVQIVFLLLFVWLLIKTRMSPGSGPSPLLKLFFWIDPLVLAATWLSAHAVPLVLLLSLVTVAVTMLLGRVFCGWICPLGTLHAACGWVVDRVWPNRRRRDHWSPWQRAKYYLLAGLLVMALLGGHWVCVFDPLVFLYRSMATVVMPGVQWAVDESTTAVFKADPGVGPVRLTKVTEPVRDFFHTYVYSAEKNWTFQGSGLILAVFLATLAANAYRRRFWCRYLCPLGALLGVLAWRPLLRRRTDPATCNLCDLCACACHGAAGGAPGSQWKAAECFACMNCSESCRRGSMDFTLIMPWRKEPPVESVDLSKRALLASALGGVAGLWMMRGSPRASVMHGNDQGPGKGLVFNPVLIRPPGARDERDFLSRCVACGMCMKVCPTGGLQPTLTEAGLEGLWTPRLVPMLGYCDYGCNLCGQVCPTEAIVPLALEEKQHTRLGLAAFDITRCIPYAYQRDCIVCEEHCPIPDKAIYAVKVEVRDRAGRVTTINQPHIDPDRCIGCGVCENVCPYKDAPGVRVSSANETRHQERLQPVMTGEPAPASEPKSAPAKPAVGGGGADSPY